LVAQEDQGRQPEASVTMPPGDVVEATLLAVLHGATLPGRRRREHRPRKVSVECWMDEGFLAPPV